MIEVQEKEEKEEKEERMYLLSVGGDACLCSARFFIVEISFFHSFHPGVNQV